MKSLWITESITYVGSQLHSHFTYQNYGLAGNSIVAFRGPVKVDLSEMVDIEDVRAKEGIASDKMLNFIVEFFNLSLHGTIWAQRLLVNILADWINAKVGSIAVRRSGDDLFYDGRKLSVSIATASPVSTLIHTALNVVGSGAPISVSCLEEIGVGAEECAREVMQIFSKEVESIEFARVKVHWVK